MFEAAKAVKVMFNFTPKTAKYKDKDKFNNTRLKLQTLRSQYKQSSLPPVAQLNGKVEIRARQTVPLAAALSAPLEAMASE
jgi:hypothetical protein